MSSKQRYDDWDGSAENQSKPWKVKEAEKRQRVPHEFGDGSRYQPVPPEKKPRRALKPRQSEPAAKSRPFVPPPWLDGEDQPVARAPSAAPRAPLGQPVAQPADLEPGQILFDDKQKRYFSITRGCSYTRFYDGRVTVLPLGFDYRVTVSSRAAVRTIDVTTAFAWRDAWRAGGGLVDGFAPTAQERAAAYRKPAGLDEDMGDPEGFWMCCGTDETRAAALKAQTGLRAKLKDPKTKGQCAAFLQVAGTFSELMGSQIFSRLKERPGGAVDDTYGADVKTTPIEMPEPVAWTFEQIMLMAGFVKTGEEWTPIHYKAVLRLMGANAIPSGRNSFRKVESYGVKVLREYYAAHPTSESTKPSFLALAEPRRCCDDDVYRFAQAELGGAALGLCGRLKPAWLLRNLIDAARVPRGGAGDDRRGT